MLGKKRGGSKEDKQDAQDEIRQRIRTIAQCNSALPDSDYLCLGFIGFAGHGKSSLQNTIASFTCSPPKLKQLARAGHGEHTITPHLTRHELVIWDAASGENHSSKIMLIDTPGHVCKNIMLEDEMQAHSLERAQRMRAHIVQDLIGDLHRAGTTCVVTVVSAQNVWQDSKASMTRLQLLRGAPLQIPHTAPIHRRLLTLRQVQNVAAHHGMRAVCILTHCDVVDKAVRREAGKVLQSSALNRIHAYVARQLGLAPNFVHSMVNLLNQPDPACDLEVGRVALTAFCHALTAAEDARNEAVTAQKHRHRPKHRDDDELTTCHAGPNIRSVY